MKTLLYFIFMTFTVYGCTSSDSQNLTVATERKLDSVQISKGHGLFLQHCAVCHGSQAEGTPDWTKRRTDGKFPPPPLNGTAHSWHHSDDVLFDIIKNGTARTGGNMPDWKNRLSDEEIHSIITWIKSIWPEEIYKAWYRNNG